MVPKTALAQIITIGVIFLAVPGMFNTLWCMAAGLSDPAAGVRGGTILNLTFAFSGLFSGSVVNLVGSKWTMALGALGYPLFALGSMYANIHSSIVGDATVYESSAISLFYAANAVLGICAGLLWTAQGQLCMAYPTPEKKGLYFGIFWALFNLGPVFGGIVQFITNYNNTSSASSNASYIVFAIIMVCGSIGAALFLAKPSDVIRNDGSHVETKANVSAAEEVKNTFGLFMDPAMLLMTPLFLYSNWFYPYQNFFNGSVYTKRTAGIAASTIGFGSQMFGALALGKFLDGHGLPVKKRATYGIIFMMVFNGLLWAMSAWAQVACDVGSVENMGVDIVSSPFKTWFPKVLLNVMFGLCDSVNQVYAYWVMGQLSDDISVLARYAGYYKFIQNIGATISGFLGGWGVSPVAQIVINVIVCAVGLAGNFVAAQKYMVEQTLDEEDPKATMNRGSRGSSFSSNPNGMYRASTGN